MTGGGGQKPWKLNDVISGPSLIEGIFQIKLSVPK